tara:strand:- start:416 stop:763 length:348 start_codon:yes stop_codon:yes gene_type:complete
MKNLDPLRLKLVSANQEGYSASEDAENRFELNSREYVAWEYGFNRARKDDEKEERWNNLPWWRKMFCSLQMHKLGKTIRVPGRPKINCQSGEIVGRDPIILLKDCVFCGERIRIK